MRRALAGGKTEEQRSASAERHLQIEPWSTREGRDVRRLQGSIAILLLVLAATTSAEEPQSASPASGATFKTGTDLVALTVTVTDKADKHITGLMSDQFVVSEDGVRQRLAFFSAESLPLDLAILIDGSASMQGKIRARTKRRSRACPFAARRRPCQCHRIPRRRTGATGTDDRHVRRRVRNW